MGSVTDQARFVLDTNIFILLFNGRLAEQLPSGRLCCSVITEIELLSFPRLTEPESDRIRRLLSEFTIYGLDSPIKEAAIQLRRDYKLKLPDALIAATARVAQAELLTHDEQFHGVDSLVCRRLQLIP